MHKLLAALKVYRVDIAVAFIAMGILAMLFMLSVSADIQTRQIDILQERSEEAKIQANDNERIIFCTIKYFDVPRAERIDPEAFMEVCLDENPRH